MDYFLRRKREVNHPEVGSIPSRVRSWVQVTVGKLNHSAPQSFPIIIYDKEGYFLRLMFQLLLIFCVTFLKSVLGMSWCCTSNFSFAFNEGPEVLTNFKRDFIFYKILHIYQSLIFFFSQGCTSSHYLPSLSVCITFMCLWIANEATWASKPAKGSLRLGLYNLN